MIRRPPRSTLFPTRRSSDLRTQNRERRTENTGSLVADSLISCNRYRDRRVFRLPHPGDERENLRSEEHTSELQSQSNLVCRLLLEKKKKNKQEHQFCTVTAD